MVTHAFVVALPARQLDVFPSPLCRSPLAHMFPAESTTLRKNGIDRDKLTVQLKLVSTWAMVMLDGGLRAGAI